MDYVPDPSERSYISAAYPYAAPDAPNKNISWFDVWVSESEGDEDDD